MKKAKHGIPGILYKLIAILFWLTLWEVVSRLVASELLIPSPTATVRRIIALAQESEFWLTAAFTLLRVAIGFLIGIILGVLAGILSVKSRLAHEIISPAMTLIKAAPVTSFILLLLIWISNGAIPPVVASLLVAPIICSNVERGIINADRSLIEVSMLFRLSPIKKLRALWIPAVKPYFDAGCASSLGLAWKSAVAAEVICHPHHSIGGFMYESKLYLETTDLFAWTAIVIILSVAAEKIINRISGGAERDS